MYDNIKNWNNQEEPPKVTSLEGTDESELKEKVDEGENKDGE